MMGGLTFESRFHLSSGKPVEENLWLSPFITDDNGAVVWQMRNGTPHPNSIPEKQIDAMLSNWWTTKLYSRRLTT